VKPALAVGIDIGTSGVRAAALDEDGETVGGGEARFHDAAAARDPAAWWLALEAAVAALREEAPIDEVLAVAVDGTSGTILAIDADGRPVAPPAMYNDPSDDPGVVEAIARHAPPSSPVRGATSPLAKAIVLARRGGVHRIVHQADWLAMRLGEGAAVSDENNALKTGFGLDERAWPEWIEAAGLDRALLPEVRPAGARIGPAGEAGLVLGFGSAAMVHCGTTDGCASFLATGASEIGDGVTALGSTLVLKLLSAARIEAPDHGVYSHRIGSLWLAGGASNSGGAVIRALLPDADLDALTRRVDPGRPTGLGYYPLLRPGERFPTSDAALAPRLLPRPADDAVFFQGLLEGIADIEAEGYRRLASLGGPPLGSVRTVGGGAQNLRWQAIREKKLGVPFLAPRSLHAAAGVARLALLELRR
jgi:sugar (pentulose or hexulose) kinase